MEFLNGLLRGYRILYHRTDSNETFHVVVGPSSLSVDLRSLSKHSIYSISVVAFTVGDGRASEEIVIATDEDSKIAGLLVTRIYDRKPDKLHHTIPYCFNAIPHTTYHTIPYHTIPYHTIPYHTILYHTILYHTIQYHTIPYYTIQYHTIPYHTIPYYTIPYHSIPYHTTPHHTILYHTISYHTIPYYDVIIKRVYKDKLLLASH